MSQQFQSFTESELSTSTSTPEPTTSLHVVELDDEQLRLVAGGWVEFAGPVGGW